jgi:hypothetical protein
MRKRVMAMATTLLLTLTMAIGSAVPAFAYYDENAANEDSSAVVVEENIEETEAEETEPETEQPSGVLTPDGNMNLIDDVDGDEAGLQFMTVTTRDGSYFYIIIDRSAKDENVYFLNQVDAADLMKLMSDDEKAAYEESQKEPEQQTPVITPTETPDDQPQVEPDTPAEKNPMASTLPLLGVFVVLGAAVAGGYYFLKIKPKKGQSNVDEDREFYDDDEYEAEEMEDEDIFEDAKDEDY